MHVINALNNIYMFTQVFIIIYYFNYKLSKSWPFLLFTAVVSSIGKMCSPL